MWVVFVQDGAWIHHQANSFKQEDCDNKLSCSNNLCSPSGRGVCPVSFPKN